MRSVSLCNLLALLTPAIAMAQGTNVNAVRGRISERVVVGSTTLGEVLRVVGSPTVSSGTGTMNPVVFDADGDALEDSNTTVSTGGAWTWGGAGSFTSTLGVTGLLSGNTGTLLLGDTRVTGTTPSWWLHDSDAATGEKYTALEADGGLLALRLYDDTPSASNVVFQLDRDALVPGDWRWGALTRTIRPENNGGSVLGSYTKMYETAYIWDLVVGTLTAKEIIATIGGEVIVAPTTSLTRDAGPSDTAIYVKHNQARVNDTLYLKVNGSSEKMLVTDGPTDCSVSGNCGVQGNDYGYNVTRNRAGGGAKSWLAGAAVVNEGNTGDGFISIYADRSSSVSDGYRGMVVSDGPAVYFGMAETSSGQSADIMGSGLAAVEGGTQSNGLGVITCIVGQCNDPSWENLGGAGYLTVSDVPGLRYTGDVTIEFFAAWQRTTPQTEVVFSKGFAGEYHLQAASDGALSFCHGNTSTFSCVTTAAGFMPSDGSTHHYAVVRDSASSPKRVLIYKDGALGFSATYTQTVATSTTDVFIGRNLAAGADFDGYIDEFAIYNYQVPANRIALHAAAQFNNAISKFTIGPTLCGNVRTGTGAFDVAERWCLGNLAGTYGYASSTTSVYGFAAGNSSATWISADATNGFRIMNGSTVKTAFDTSGNGLLTGDLSIGTSGSLRSGATAYDTGTGYWLDYNSGSPRFRIGTTSAGTSYLRWTGSALQLKSDDVSIDENGVLISGVASASDWAPDKAYRFDFGDGSTYGLSAYQGGGNAHIVSLQSIKNGTAGVIISAQNSSNTDAIMILTSHNAGNPSRIDFSSERVYVNGSQAFSGSCASSATLTVVNGLITGGC